MIIKIILGIIFVPILLLNILGPLLIRKLKSYQLELDLKDMMSRNFCLVEKRILISSMSP